jgi:hypothetical protein
MRRDCLGEEAWIKGFSSDIQTGMRKRKYLRVI